MPKGVDGKIDGQKPPMTQLEDLQKAVEPYQKVYGLYLANLRPWREFLQLSRPRDDVRQRLESNLVHFQTNYAVIFLALSIVMIVTSPQCLLVICVLALAWVAFLRKNQDPNWVVTVAGFQLSNAQRWMGFMAISILVLLSFVGKVLASAAVLCALLVAAHGALHPVVAVGAFEIDDDMI